MEKHNRRILKNDAWIVCIKNTKKYEMYFTYKKSINHCNRNLKREINFYLGSIL